MVNSAEAASLLRMGIYLLSRRKQRLLACAFLRQIWDLLDERSKNIVEQIERIAENCPIASNLIHPEYELIIDLHELAYDNFISHTHAFSPVARCIVSCTLIDEFFAAIETRHFVSTAAWAKRIKVQEIQKEIIHDMCPFKTIKYKAIRTHDMILNKNWITPLVVGMAEITYNEQQFPLDRVRLMILADALEESGCNDQLVLDHLRANATHVKGCWVLDSILSKE